MIADHVLQGRLAPIRAVLFDKDGTIVDFDRTWGPAVEAVLKDLARGDKGLFRKLADESGLIDGGHFRPDSPLIEQPARVVAARWAKSLGRPVEPAFLEEIDQLLCEATTAHLAPIGDPKAVMSQLLDLGYRLGLVTNDAEFAARAHVCKLGIEPMLAFIAGYDSGFAAKPAPGLVLAFSAAVGIPPEQIAVVGDTALDVATARSAGARAVVVATGPRSYDPAPETAPDAVIASIMELPAWLGVQSGSAPTS